VRMVNLLDSIITVIVDRVVVSYNGPM